MGITTKFGFEDIPEEDKAKRVQGVFDSVARRYDLMNDLMSAGMHRMWKRFAVELSGLRKGMRALDVAGGTGDLSALMRARVGETGQVWLTDINGPMLARGRDRLLDEGRIGPALRCDAERLPFASDYFDCVMVAFGLRNMTHKSIALTEMRRVLRAGGRLVVLEFSHVWKPLAPLYDAYSFHVVPRIGRAITKDEASYRYLAESIRVHPAQEELAWLIKEAGLERVEYFNLAAGVVALHRGYKL